MREFVVPVLATVCFLGSLITIAVLTLNGSTIPGEVSATLQVSLGGVLTSGILASQRPVNQYPNG